MKTICVFVVGAGILMAQTAATTAPKSKAKKTAKSVAPTEKPLTEIPKDAVADGNNFHWVDKQGKAWTLTPTPFGIKKTAVVPATTASAQTTEQSKPKTDGTLLVTAVADGDFVKFSKPGPFGMFQWRKNKNELTADEQRIWAREQAKGNQ